VFSSHTIEHVADPFLMFSELYRVASRKVIIRYPHKRSSGANRPFHINFLDEKWFDDYARLLGVKVSHFINSFDYPITNRLHLDFLHGTFLWRVLRHIERKLVFKLKIPFESEASINKQVNVRFNDPVCFVVVYNDLKVLSDCFLKSNGLATVCLFENCEGISLPVIFNRKIAKFLNRDCWIVFCHQDFILKDDLRKVLAGKDAGAVYGVVGAHQGRLGLLGRIMQSDGSFIGAKLTSPVFVQTVDEVCFIIHSSVFRSGLRFDEHFSFDFYGADLCLQAYRLGFGVYALQVDCQHKSKSLVGNLNSACYLRTKKFFRAKWLAFLPVRTSTCLIGA
jgi:hypothetical protein